MKSLFNQADRAALLARLERLTPDIPPRWGKFNATRMVAHLNDVVRMATGELAVVPRPGKMTNVVMRNLFIYFMPFPKSVPTAPELLARGSSAEFSAECAAFRVLVEKAAARPVNASWPNHSLFGGMTRNNWGALGHKHIVHHFKQFGI
ncbi:MAG: DUF1569 domain-containing protein [Gemmatimonadetes bacterium]|nr:DUF1569 domain-containing protein [Gemmatimonadota bacterium]